MKKVVLSCIFGGHDSLKDPVRSGYNPNWQYIMFTDDPELRSEYWEIRLLNNAQGRYTAREIKLQSHLYVKYDVLLWVDASYALTEDPELILADAGDSNLYIKLHPKCNTLNHEADFCVRAGRLTQEQADNIKADFFALGFTQQIQDRGQTYETGLHLRRNTSEMFEFMSDWWRLTQACELRDQIPLSYLIWKNNPGIKTFIPAQGSNYAQYHQHRTYTGHLPDIAWVEPYANNGNLGQAYNEAIEANKDFDYVAIMDQDVCFLDSRLKQWIAESIAANPQYDVFVPVTNRLSTANQEQLSPGMYNIHNIVQHKQRTIHHRNVYGNKVFEKQTSGAGMVIIARPELFMNYPFKNGLVQIDTDWFERVMADGVRVGVMQGCYVYHYYRSAEGHRNVDHLTR